MSNESKALTDRELQSLRNMGCEFEKAANEVESLRAQLDDEADAMTVAYMHGFNKGKSIGSQLAARVPDGWKLVPVEPTNEMLIAGQYHINMHKCYAAMLSAAPSQQAPVAQVSKDSPSGEPVAAMRGGKFQWLVSWFPPGNVDFYTTPQQASEVSSGTTSEPMTYELVIKGFEQADIAPQDTQLSVFDEGVRFAERHHQIKGKQCGDN